MEDKKKRAKHTRLKISNYPSTLPRTYCTDEMRSVLERIALKEGTDMAKAHRHLIEESPIYKQELEKINNN